MKKENFELFLGCLGNGITVCNKSVEENGAYKTIEHFADVQREKWEKWLDSMPELKRYEKLLETVPADIMLYAMNLNGELWQKINYLKQVCYEKPYF